MASIAVRAALETEKGATNPRFDDYRSGGQVFLAVGSELKTWVVRLGQTADKQADENPIPAPSRVLEALRAVTFPGTSDSTPSGR